MIREELPRLTQDLNSLAMQYDASRGELTNDATSANDAVKTVLSRGTQMIMSSDQCRFMCSTDRAVLEK